MGKKRIWFVMKKKHQFFVDIVKFPNLLCLYRLFAIIASCILFISNFPILGSLFGLTAGLTDYWDGYYARKHNMVTRLGALLDTAADLMFNFFVISSAVYMREWPIWILFAWGFRDLSVLTMRASAAQLGFDIPSSYLGKVASNFIFYALFLMPISWALNHDEYRFAKFVLDNIHEYVGIGLHYFTLAAVIIGIILQWKAAAQYATVYIRKYDEIHQAEKAKDKDSDTDKDETEDTESDKDSESSDHEKTSDNSEKAADSVKEETKAESKDEEKEETKAESKDEENPKKEESPEEG